LQKLTCPVGTGEPSAVTAAVRVTTVRDGTEAVCTPAAMRVSAVADLAGLTKGCCPVMAQAPSVTRRPIEIPRPGKKGVGQREVVQIEGFCSFENMTGLGCRDGR
jgi:hypothetical protein